jgi:hypothetical protein
MLLDFQFLVILNLFVGLIWWISGPYRGTRSDVPSIIITVLAVVAVVLDIVFLVLKFMRP